MAGKTQVNAQEPKENTGVKVNLDAGIIKTLDVNQYKNVLVLTGVLSKNVFMEKIQPSIKTKCHIFSDILQTPTDTLIYNIVHFAKSKKIDCILSVGDEAVMDSGRLVNLLLSNGGFLHEYVADGAVGRAVTASPIRHITVPVINGNGAEISSIATFIMNKQRKEIGNPFLIPYATFIDPELMTGTAGKIWSIISFECFANALAAYVSAFANPTSDAFSEMALKGYMEYAHKLSQEPDNIEYIKQMAVASMNAFLAMSFSSRGAAHAIASVLSAKFNIQFSLALVMVAGDVHGMSYEFNKEKYDKVAALMGEPTGNMKQLLKKLIIKQGMVMSHISVQDNMDDSLWEKLAYECFSYIMRGNPKILTMEEVVKILKRLP